LLSSRLGAGVSGTLLRSLAGGRASGGGTINAKYGIDPGFVFYTHVSGRYGPFHTQVIAATVSEAPYVLDGLMHHVHQTDLRIREHYTDTAGATEHVFGLCCLLGFQFAPRIKDLNCSTARRGPSGGCGPAGRSTPRWDAR